MNCNKLASGGCTADVEVPFHLQGFYARAACCTVFQASVGGFTDTPRSSCTESRSCPADCKTNWTPQLLGGQSYSRGHTKTSHESAKMTAGKSKGDASRPGKRKGNGFVEVTDGAGSSKMKKAKKSKGLALQAGGGAVTDGERKDDLWDKKFEGQLFGGWSDTEKELLKERIKDWAAAHGHSDAFDKEEWEFLFKRRHKQGGRGAKMEDSERKAFLEIAKDFGTRNPKQVYGFITRHYDPNNYKGKWSEDEKEKLSALVQAKGEKWKDIGLVLQRPGGACRDKWRTMRDKYVPGEWSNEELTCLKQLVNEQFAAQGSAPGRGPGEGNEHLPVRDNINWKAISLKMKTRSENICLQKWYRIAPDAVAAGEWGEGDDATMVAAIQKSRVSSEVHVAWESLVRGRTLSQIKGRFKVLKQATKDHHKITFLELMAKLAEKHCTAPRPLALHAVAN